MSRIHGPSSNSGGGGERIILGEAYQEFSEEHYYLKQEMDKFRN